MKKLIAIVVLSACSQNESKLDAPKKKQERNFVCERFKIINEKAECTPEYSDFGDGRVHTARIKVGENVIACGIANGQISVICGDLIAVPQKPQEQPTPAPTTETSVKEKPKR